MIKINTLQTTLIVITLIFKIQACILPHHEQNTEHFTTQFFDSVASAWSADRAHILQTIKKDFYWLRAQKIYDSFVRHNCLQSQCQLRIPKKIHQIWLGGLLPEKYKTFQKSWIKHHPGWEYKLWGEKEIAALHLTNQTAYDQSKNYAQKADIARYEILFREGGLYIDTDFECLQPFDVLHYCCDFYVGIDKHDTQFLIQNCIIGSKPGHPILAMAIKTLDINKQYKPSYYDNIQFTTGPYHLSACYKTYISHRLGRAVAFPPSFFFPWPTEASQKSPEALRAAIKPESMGIHYWDASWIS